MLDHFSLGLCAGVVTNGDLPAMARLLNGAGMKPPLNVFHLAAGARVHRWALAALRNQRQLLMHTSCGAGDVVSFRVNALLKL